MFEDLSAKLETVFKKLRRHGKLSESNVKDALREVRRDKSIAAPLSVRR